MKKIYLIKQFKVCLHNIVYNNMSQAQEQTESINNIFNSFNTINDSITLFKMQLNSLQQQLKNLEKSVLSIEFLYDYQDNDLKDISRKRITIRVGLDLGPNPKTEDISSKVSALAVSINSIQKSKVL